MRLSVFVVLIVIDRSADVILPLIDLLALLPGQVAAVRRSIIRDLAIDARFPVLDVPGLSRRHLPGTNPLGNALLLVFSPLPGREKAAFCRRPPFTDTKLPRSACAICMWFCCSTVASKCLSRANAASRLFSRTWIPPAPPLKLVWLYTVV